MVSSILLAFVSFNVVSNLLIIMFQIIGVVGRVS